MTRWIEKLLTGLLMLTISLVTGCLGINALPSDFGQVVGEMAKMIEDQGVLDEFTSDIEGDVFNPGLESYMIIGAGVRLVGVQGEVDLVSSGTGTQLPKGVREELIRQLGGPLSDEQRNAILTTLGWNRVTSEHNPAPGG